MLGWLNTDGTGRDSHSKEKSILKFTGELGRVPRRQSVGLEEGISRLLTRQLGRLVHSTQPRR